VKRLGAVFRSHSHRAVICVYDEAGNLIETHEHAREFKDFLKKSGDRREKDTKPVIARPLQGGFSLKSAHPNHQTRKFFT
jgi:hypothetical protein